MRAKTYIQYMIKDTCCVVSRAPSSVVDTSVGDVGRHLDIDLCTGFAR